MFDLKRSYGFNKALAEGGARMLVGSNADEDYILIRKMPNDSYRTKMQSVMMANRKTLDILAKQDKAAHDRRDTELMCEVLAETVVVGWGKGVSDGGKPIPYSTETAKKMLVEYPEFRSDCISFASDNNNYPLEIDAEDVKKK